jgi:asparagine synthase (glutamine-hydrolysing)
MCGFAGILTTAGYPGDVLAEHAGRMSGRIAHRGPDDSGVWVDEQAGVAFGFRRLAIIDLSPNGHQPMRSPSGRFVIVFNGEIYNFADLRRELEACGHGFRGSSDTEVILAAFEQWGIHEAVCRFVGMFAIAAWDTHRRELSLVRDRLGKKPLYVYREPGLITFGSELKALLAGPSFDRSIDRGALASYLRYLCVPAPKSIFQHAVKVKPAHILTVSDARCPLPASREYWSLHRAALDGLASPFGGTEQDAVDELEALLADAVRRRMYADVPLGALLSGGIDSSTVVALMQEAGNRPVKSYTVGFTDREFDEARYAADVARHIGTDHTQLTVTGDEAPLLVPQLADIFDEPFANPSQLPTFLVCQLARQSITVALCGDGGDELFGGYNRYLYGSRILPRVHRVPWAVRRPVAAAIGSVPSAAWDRLSRMTAAVIPGLPQVRVGERMHKLGDLMGAASVEDMYRSLLSTWQHPDDVMTRHHVAEDSAGTMPEGDNGSFVPGADPSHLLDRMMLCDQSAYLPDDQLAKIDRASMGVSLEVRAPLLDHRLVEFSWRLPRAFKVQGNVSKWILRQVLYRRVPKQLLERPKMGFTVPIDRWLRGPLRSWAEDLLSPDELRKGGLLDPPAVMHAWKDLQENRRQAGAALWAVIMFQAWRARWVA